MICAASKKKPPPERNDRTLFELDLEVRKESRRLEHLINLQESRQRITKNYHVVRAGFGDALRFVINLFLQVPQKRVLPASSCFWDVSHDSSTISVVHKPSPPRILPAQIAVESSNPPYTELCGRTQSERCFTRFHTISVSRSQPNRDPPTPKRALSVRACCRPATRGPAAGATAKTSRRRWRGARRALT